MDGGGVVFEDTSTSLIEGISNDVVLVFCVSVASIVATVLWYKTSSRNTLIHPNHLQNVQAARQRVLQSRGGDPNDLLRGGDTEHTRNNNRQPRSEDDRCPICLDQIQFAVETNCGHIFCTRCVLSYYEHGAFVAAMNCPVCRQLVRVLLTDFTHEEEVDDDVETHLRSIRAYNSRYSGEPRPVLDYIYDFPVLLRHMFRNFFSVSGLVLMLRVRIAMYLFIVVVYVLSPLDIIPESVYLLPTPTGRRGEGVKIPHIPHTLKSTSDVRVV